MSQADQARWDQRYRDGAYAERRHPSDFLQRRFASLALPKGARVLDLACGAGRNALYLASQGCAVTAIDGSAVAVQRAADHAEVAGLEVQWQVADLELGLPGALGTFDLIVLVRYVNALLLAALPAALRPSGVLLVEQHLQTPAQVGGPGRAAFRVPRGTLRATVPTLTCVVAEQGLIADPDGAQMALSRLLARR